HLWRALRQPPLEHPLYQRLVMGRLDAVPFIAWGLALIAAPIILLPALLLIGTTYGLIWTMNISQAIVQEKSSGNYDLVNLTPCGEFGQNWIISAACMHRNQTYTRIHSLGLWVLRIGIPLSFLIPNLGGNSAYGYRGVIFMPLIAAAVIIVMVVDHFQSIAAGLLAGLLAPTISSDGANIRLTAVGLFGGVQISTYLITGLATFAILPIFSDALSVNNVLVVAIILIFLVVLLCTLREIALLLLWKQVTNHLNTSQVEAFEQLNHQ
ncbi:MAG: hypothetical protein H7Y09_11840, partial [Chitinophagaceae bacterium]|nr:hypothetical protein [Anaerolineae bacterium]